MLFPFGFLQTISTFDFDYQAVLTYATSLGYTLPSSGQQVKQNQLMLDLKSSGVWNKLDTFGLFATDGSFNFALIDWKRLTTYTAVNSPTFSSNGGFTGNGTSSYIDTNFNPSTSGVNYQLNNASRCFWVDNRTTITSNAWEGNSSANSNNQSTNTNSLAHRINSQNALNTAVNFQIDGWKSINRPSSTNVELFTNLTQYSRTSTSQSIFNSNQFVLRSSSNYNSSRFRFYGMGASMVSENTDFYNAINNYLTSI